MSHNTSMSEDNQLELLMRHSSPLMSPRGAVTSPLTERQTQPSPLHLSRPRSNPRQRTPMRFSSPEHSTIQQIPEDSTPAPEARRISIRPLAGRPVGTTRPLAGTFTRPEPQRPKSRKQGPSQRKIRRWKNNNLAHLASELNTNQNGQRAAQALLLGHADAAEYRSSVQTTSTSQTATRWIEDETLQGLRDQFYAGELMPNPTSVPSHSARAKPVDEWTMTPDQMFLRIDTRLRKVISKACENSAPACHVVDLFEQYLRVIHTNKTEGEAPVLSSSTWWDDLLLEAPVVTRSKSNEVLVHFAFDAQTPTGGFHRLLLHGLCQFHGIKARSTTESLTMNGKSVQVRLLSAVGTMSERSQAVQLTTYLMAKEVQEDNVLNEMVDMTATHLQQALKV